jgi:sugar lactone lactonase YvrE
MQKPLKAVAHLLLFLCIASSVLSQTPEEMTTAQTAEQAARKAFGEKNYAEALSQLVIANNSRPNHPRLIYNLAVANALNGMPDRAVDSLERLANMGLSFPAERDPNFKAIAETERFKKVVARFAANREPLNKSLPGITVDQKSLIAESVAYDSRTGTFYIGSVHQRKIVAVDKSGKVRDFSQPGDELWSVLGLKVDEKRGILWACSTAFPQMKGFTTPDKGRAGVFKYDLSSSRLLKRYLLPPGEDHALGDLLLDSDGNVFATDSVSPVIYKITAGGDTIDESIRSNMFASLQGLTFDATGKSLYVADYSKGIYRIDLASKNIIQQKPGEFITLLGIDGIYLHKGDLIAIQNGVTPNRIMRLSIKNDAVIAQEVLEANHPDFNEPTLGVLVKDDLFFVANSQWAHVNEKGELATEKLAPTKILKLALKGGK